MTEKHLLLEISELRSADGTWIYQAECSCSWTCSDKTGYGALRWFQLHEAHPGTQADDDIELARLDSEADRLRLVDALAEGE